MLLYPRIKFYILLTLFFIPFSFLLPQTQNSSTILGLSVEGNKSAEASTIIANSGLKIGDEVTIPGDKTINAIKQLWALNIFSDVQIVEERRVGNGIYLLIKVAEFPRMEKYVIRGNDEVDEDDIDEKVGLISAQILRPQRVQTIVGRIKKLYQEKGMQSSQIAPLYYEFAMLDSTSDQYIVTWRDQKNFSDEITTEYAKADVLAEALLKRVQERMVLVFDIKEGDLARIRKISFEGNEAFDDDELKSQFDDTEEAVWWKFWASTLLDRDKLKTDKELLVKFYRKNGYRDAEIVGDTVILSNNNKDIHLVVKVYEGMQYKVRNITWQGNTIYTDDVLQERLDMYPGDVFDVEKFNQNLRGNEKQNDIASLYLDNGYLTFNVRTNETTIAPDSIDIQIQVYENNQFTIGKVDVTGNDKTKDKVIRRELYSIPGDYFNRGALLRSLQQLANLQFFNVEKLYQKGVDYQLGNDSTVNITFLVEEKSSDYLNASIGYSGSFGFSGAIGVTLTNFSISEPFQLGAGQVLSFNWQFGVGNLYRTFTLGFTEPWFLDTPTLIGFELFSTRQRYIYDLSQYGGTARVGRRLRWPDDYFYVQGTFRYQNNDVIDGGNFYRTGKSEQFSLGATITRKNVDNPIFPSLGSSVSLDMEINGGPFLPGNVDYFKIGFKADFYRRLFNSNRVTLYLGSEFGYMDELISGTPVNPFEYYYMGGSGLVIATTSLRGYDDRTVGPRNEFGDVIGGRVSAKFVSELRFAVSLDPIPLYVLGFAEAGRVFESIKTTDLMNLRKSIGVGARILINPIGLIGFDVGYGFDRKAVDGTDPNWQFHFQFGKGF